MYDKVGRLCLVDQQAGKDLVKKVIENDQKKVSTNSIDKAELMQNVAQETAMRSGAHVAKIVSRNTVRITLKKYKIVGKNGLLTTDVRAEKNEKVKLVFYQ